jgi:hypothetical protein
LQLPPAPRPAQRRAPTPPEPPATSRSYVVRVDDPTGPGCGWTFTDTTPPVFDIAGARRDADTARRAAISELRAARAAALTAAASAAAAERSFEQYRADRAAWQAYDDARARLSAPPSTTTTVPPTTTTTTAPSTSTTVPPSSTTSTTTTVPTGGSTG